MYKFTKNTIFFSLITWFSFPSFFFFLYNSSKKKHTDIYIETTEMKQTALRSSADLGNLGARFANPNPRPNPPAQVR
jgi:hypothetical protein